VAADHDDAGTEIEAGTPLIGLEPACLTAFRDELLNLFPNDALAKRLSEQSVFFSEFLADHADGLKPRRDGAKALVQVHCHQHAVIKADGERKLLDRLGVDYEVLPSGCCGMAGAFGFEPLVLTNGFSCREQIEQGAGRKTLHAAELAARCLGA
jgi:Fe-S oxidoreductase